MKYYRKTSSGDFTTFRDKGKKLQKGRAPSDLVFLDLLDFSSPVAFLRTTIEAAHEK
jgi:hypothetical protein